VVICQKGLKLSQGVAAWLRHEGHSGRLPRRRGLGMGAGRVCPWCRKPNCRPAMLKGGRSG
jgi:hypothetical protein